MPNPIEDCPHFCQQYFCIETPTGLLLLYLGQGSIILSIISYNFKENYTLNILYIITNSRTTYRTYFSAYHIQYSIQDILCTCEDFKENYFYTLFITAGLVLTVTFVLQNIAVVSGFIVHVYRIKKNMYCAFSSDR